MKFKYGDKVMVTKGSLKKEIFLVSGLVSDNQRLLINKSRQFTTKRMRRKSLKSYSFYSINTANVRHIDTSNKISKVYKGFKNGFKVRFCRSDGSLLRGDALMIVNTKRRLILKGRNNE